MKRVKVRTRPRTMSGYRGGLVLTLDADEAQRWIDRRWADPADQPQREPERPRQKRQAATL